MNEANYVVYRIFNTVTGKCYIGITNNFRERKWRHLNDLKSNTHHSIKLQNAYNKYGETAFEWALLEDGLLKEGALEAEIKWVAHFDSFRSGYNMTEGGYIVTYMGWYDVPYVWNGIEYPSTRDASNALGVDTGALLYRKKKGYVSDEDMSKPHPISRGCVWNGIEYPSISAAASAVGISRGAMMIRLRNGYVCDNDVSNKQSGVVWNNIEYPSVSECSKALGIKHSTVYQRMSKGYTSDADLISFGQNKVKICVWNGVTYVSQTAAAKALGIKVTAMNQRIKRGWTCDDDVPPRSAGNNRKPVEWNGVKYSSITAAAKDIGIRANTLITYLRKGYTCDEDVKNNKVA